MLLISCYFRKVMLIGSRLGKVDHVIKIVNFEVRHFSLTFTEHRIFAKLLQSEETILQGTVVVLQTLGYYSLSLFPWLCESLRLPAGRAKQSRPTTSKTL